MHNNYSITVTLHTRNTAGCFPCSKCCPSPIPWFTLFSPHFQLCHLIVNAKKSWLAVGDCESTGMHVPDSLRMQGSEDVSQNRGCRIVADSKKQVSRGEGEEKNPYWILCLCYVSGKMVEVWANNKEQQNHRGCEILSGVGCNYYNCLQNCNDFHRCNVCLYGLLHLEY